MWSRVQWQVHSFTTSWLKIIIMGVGKGPQDGALTGRRWVVESDLKLCKTPADICISYCAQCQRKNDHYHCCYYCSLLINLATVLLTFCLSLHHPRMKLSEKGAGVVLAGSSECEQSCTDAAFQSVTKVTDKNTLCLLRDTFMCSGREYLSSCGRIRAPRFWHRNVYPWHFWVCLWLIFMCDIIMFNRRAPGSWSSGRLPNCDALSVFFNSCYFRPGELYCFTNKCITHFDDWYICGFASMVSLFLFIIEMKIYFRKWKVWPAGLLVSGQRIILWLQMQVFH